MEDYQYDTKETKKVDSYIDVVEQYMSIGKESTRSNIIDKRAFNAVKRLYGKPTVKCWHKYRMGSIGSNTLKSLTSKIINKKG